MTSPRTPRSRWLELGAPPSVEQRNARGAVERYLERAVRPLAERPERVPTAAQLGEVRRLAEELGLLAAPAASGLGLWEEPSVAGCRWSVGLLHRVARESATAALCLHHAALGLLLGRRLGVEDAAPWPWLYAELGLDKGLRGAALGAPPVSEAAPAEPELAPLGAGEAGRPLLLGAAEPWSALLLPRWSDARRLSWWRLPRATLELTPAPHALGLDGLSTWQVRAPRLGELLLEDVAAALALYREVLALDALGLVGIGLGATEGALAAAKDYAALRRQGGKLIVEHVAVRLLLSGAEANVLSVQALLADMTLRPEALARVLALRSVAHPQLCEAASHALQVFGGTGYLQDTGIERRLRDNYHLRLLAGTPTDLRLTALAMEDGR